MAQKSFRRHQDDNEDHKAGKQARKMAQEKVAKRERREQFEEEWSDINRILQQHGAYR